jgi:amino acid adenylation domain
MIDQDNIESVSGLGAMQRGMVFDHALDPRSDAYVEQFDLRARGEVEENALRDALVATSRHFSVLRTVFSFRNTDDPYQIVLRDRRPPLEVVDLTGRLDPDAALEAVKREDRSRGFNLSSDPLLRCTVVRLGPGRTHLLLTFHHVILDGWSLAPLFITLFSYYEEIRRTGTWHQGIEDRPYLDYVAWCENQSDVRAREFWTEEIGDYQEPTGIHADLGGEGFKAANHTFALGEALTARMNDVAVAHRLTPSTIFLAAWGLVLQRFNYAEDAVFGAVVSGRGIALEGIESMVGLFVNTQLVRVFAGADETFVDVARRVQTNHHRATEHAWFPLHEVLGVSPLRGALIDHVVAFENYPLSEQLQSFDGDGGSLGLEGVEVYERTSYGMHVVVNPGRDLRVTFTYNALAYSHELVTALAHALVDILTAALSSPLTPLSTLPTGPVEADSDAPASRPAPELGQSLMGVFKDVVAVHGGRIALDWNGGTLTYAELDAWSDAVAWRLRGCVPSEGGVGLLVDSRPELVVGMLAILKIGRPYVPLDVRDVAVRRAGVIADAGLGVVCTVTDFQGLADVPNVVLLDETDRSGRPFPWEHRDCEADAFLMYTSGSTGGPKGCFIPERGILRLVFGQEYLDFGPDRVFLQASSPAFDACTLEVWGSLLHGSRLVLPDRGDVLDPKALGAIIREKGVDTLWLTAPLFNQVCDHDPTLLGSLADLLVGGSALSVPHVAQFSRACPHVRVTNGYGPTENSTFSTTHRIVPDDLTRPRIPIGRTLRYSTARVVGRDLKPVPVGALGELLLGGMGLSRGYHGRSDLTASRFVSDPDTGAVWYRSGDLVRQMRTGEFDYIGRIDDQVKVSGFRVELGEVEGVLLGVSGVRDGAVLALDQAGVKRLRGYVVLQPGASLDGVRRELVALLPPYMVPSTLTQIDDIPLNRNGKVDRVRLATVEPPAGEPKTLESRASLGPVHSVVAEVLGRPTVDVDVSFFDLGLTSLDLLAVSNRLRARLGRDVPITLLFQYTSVAALERHVRGTPIPDAATTSGTALPSTSEPDLTDLPILTHFLDDSEGSLDHA